MKKLFDSRILFTAWKERKPVYQRKRKKKVKVVKKEMKVINPV